MLRALTEELSRIEGPHDTSSNALSVNSAAERLRSSPLFHRALQLLLSREVQGCTKEPEEALQQKAKGTECFAKGQYEAAAQHYSEALTWLASTSQPAEAARVHANRALCLLKLADADNSAPAAAAAAGPGAIVLLSSKAAAGPDSRRCRKMRKLAAAAVEDCTAALGCCEQGLTHKVMFRRAQAHLLLHRHAEAAADCQAAHAAAQQYSAPGAAAAVRDCQELLQRIEMRMQQQGVNTPQQGPSTGSAVPRVRLQAHAQSHQQQEPPSGLSLAQINILLAYQQQEAQQYIQQLHAPDRPGLDQGHADTAETMGLLLRHKLRIGATQQKCAEESQQQGLAQLAAIQCCYSAAKGRYLVATVDIPAGTIVLAEMPLAAVPIKPQKQQQGNSSKQLSAGVTQESRGSSGGPRCGWCLEAIGISAWPCPACPLARYCSSACRQAACSSNFSHLTATGTAEPSTGTETGQHAAAAICAEHAAGGIECGRPWTRLLPEEAVLASRCLRARTAAAGIAASLPQAQAPAAADGACLADRQHMPPAWHEVCQQQDKLHLEALRATLLDSLTYHPSSACSNNGGSIHQSAEQQSQVQQQQRGQQLALASIVAQIHASAAPVVANGAASDFQHTTSAPAADSPVALLKCLQQLAANGIAIRPFLSAGPGDRWGLGLYPVTAAVVNHDCDPNCSIRFHGRQLLLVCHRGASAGEELHISYGPQIGLHSTHERQELLQQQYGFQCTCDSCLEGLHGRQPGKSGAPCAAASHPAKKPHAAAAGASTPTWQQEAAAVGLRCCGCDKQFGSTTSRSMECMQRPCPGALVPAVQLPAGVVSLQPMSTSTSRHVLGPESGSCSAGSTGRASQQLHAQCTECGWVMPPDLLQQKLLALRAAAADAEAACSMMADLAEQQTPAQAQQPDRRLQQVQQALKLLQEATDVRQQHLAAGTHLLGHSHHATAAAAVEAAVLAAAHAQVSAGASSSSTAANNPASTLVPLLDSSLSTLKDSLRMQTEEEVSSVLLRLQDMLQVLQDSRTACTCASCSSINGSMETAETVLQLPCSCSQQNSEGQGHQLQQEGCQHSAQPRLAQPDNSTGAHAGPAHDFLQGSLSLAFLHFSKSAAVLGRSHPADSLALAAEQAACCAAGLGFVTYSAPCSQGAAACSQCADEADGRAAHAQVQGGQEAAQQGSRNSCCRYGAVLSVVAHILQEVSATVDAHIGFMV